MIICPQCTRDNEDHYKFCLGCGAELQKAVSSPSPPRAPVVVARTVPMPTGSRGLGRPLPPLPVPSAVPLATALPAAKPLPSLPMPARVVVGFDDAQPFDPTVDSVPGGVPGLDEAPPFDAPPAGLENPPVEPEQASLPASLPAPSREPPPVDEPGLARLATAPPAEAFDPPTAPPGPVFEDPFAAPSAAESGEAPRVIRVEQAETAERAVASASNTVEVPDAEPPTEAPVHQEPPTDRVRRVDLEDIPLSTRPPLGRADPTVVGEEPGFDLHASLVSVVRDAASRRCPSCKSAVPEGFKFCGVCGSRYEPAAQAASPVLRARLVLIHPDGREGDAFDLPAGECVVGRDVGPAVFAEDPFLSPRHATFSSGPGRLSVRDEGSLNGVFLRLRAEVELMHRDLFRVGQQLLRFEDMRHVRPVVQSSNDGTLVFGSPTRGTWGRLAALVAVETAAHVWTLAGPQVTLGRERGDIKFPQDGFVSGTHCTVSTRQGRFFLSDQGSTNGTYLRVKGEQALVEGDLLLLGQQLFRVVVG